MAAETKTGFLVDGTVYEVPDMGTLTLDEAQTLYDYCGLTIEDFVPPEGMDDAEFDADIAAKTRNPGFTRALMHIAYQRGNPKIPAARVKQLVGSANLFEQFEHLAGEPDETEEDQVPLASTSELEPSSQKSSLENENSTSQPSETPGNVSAITSDEPDGRLHRIGASRSAPSFTSPPTNSAA